MNNIFYFAFVGIIVVVSLYIILKILIKKFNPEESKVKLYGILQGMSNREIISISCSIISYVFMIYLMASFIDLDIYIAGLNMTSEQAPFGIMPQLLSIADEIEILHASCNECNRDAIYTYYDGKKKGDILVGNDNYIALCARCLRRKKNER